MLRQIRANKYKLFAVFGLSVIAFVALGYLSVLADMSTQRVSKKPNIIFILTDDQDKSLIKYMPNTKKFIRDKGVNFSNYFDNTSLCCVARASILRGQYAHNTKVEDNVPPMGGYYRYKLEGNDLDNLPNWMQAAGYKTSFIGKHMNGYPDLPEKNPYSGNGNTKLSIPTGWDSWISPVEGSPYSQYRYTLNNNGKLESHGKNKRDYLTDVISRKSVRYINRHVSSSQPFFMYIAPYGPHSPYTPPQRYMNMLKDKKIKYPRTTSFNERSVSDKPYPINTAPRLTTKQIQEIDLIHRKRAASVRAIDDMVKDIIDALRATNQLNNTYLVFSADNGYHLGNHRLPVGKYTPYETDIRLNLFVRGPGVQKAKTNYALAGNIDIAPTLTEMAGGSVPSFVDGVSLLPFARGTASAADSRKYYLLERKVSTFVGEPAGSSDGLSEPADPMPLLLRSGNGKQKQFLGGPFMGIRSRDGYTYVEHLDGQREFYDLNNDPYQVYNLLATGRNIQLSSVQAAKLEELRAALPQLVKCGINTTPCSQVDGTPTISPPDPV